MADNGKGQDFERCNKDFYLASTTNYFSGWSKNFSVIKSAKYSAAPIGKWAGIWVNCMQKKVGKNGKL
jgi:hypothetical protein